MRLFTILACSVLLNIAPVYAQPNLLPTVQAVMESYPHRPLSTIQLGAALNEIARRHDGWGLHRKTTGRRCEQPGGVEVSCDLLVSPSLGVYDVLIDADGNAVPTFEYVGQINSPSNFVAPTGLPTPGPVIPNPGTPPPFDPTPVYTQIAELRTLIAESAVELESLRRLVQMQQLELEHLRAGQDLLAARPVFSKCSARVFGIPVSCRLEP